MLEKLKPDTHLARVIGRWRGRQIEEEKAVGFNRTLIDSLYEMYQKDIAGKPGNKDQYINLLDPRTFGNDVVTQDSVDLLTPETLKYAKSVYDKGFYVRKDMVKDVLGHRSASVGDAWSGISRWNPSTQKALRDITMSVFGNSAYKYFVNSEKFIQDRVGDARTLIVVKSVVVPMVNLLSNMVHMLGRGIGPVAIAKGMMTKAVEMRTYTQGMSKKVALEWTVGNSVYARPIERHGHYGKSPVTDV